MKFFQARKESYHTNPILIDEVIYTPYFYDPVPSISNDSHQSRSKSRPQRGAQTGDLLGVPELQQQLESTLNAAEDIRTSKKGSKFDTTLTEAEIFLFEYGTIVIWGMTESQEKRFLSSIKRFEIGRLGMRFA
jgi:uncharacterized Rmd1/YagE family protein